MGNTAYHGAMLEFERLAVYEKAVAFVDQVYEATRAFPREEMFGLAIQMRRGATSIVLNIAEGAGRDTASDRKRFYTMARGSAFECLALITLCRRRDYVSQTKAAALRSACEELTRMLHGLRKSPGHIP